MLADRDADVSIPVRCVPRDEAGNYKKYDSVGEAYMKSGDGEAAIRSYRRALELNPRSRNAADMLRKLEQRQ